MLPKVSEEMNQKLTCKVSQEEVREAIFSINPESAPGPDGMTGLFFQKFWSVISESVTQEIQAVFDNGSLR